MVESVGLMVVGVLVSYLAHEEYSEKIKKLDFLLMWLGTSLVWLMIILVLFFKG